MATLRDLRLQKKLTLQDAAELIGITYPALSRLERGLSRPRVPTITKLAAFYNLSPEKIIQLCQARPTSFESNTSSPSGSAPISTTLGSELLPIEQAQLEAFRNGLLSSRNSVQPVQLPIIGQTAAGFGSTALSEWTGEFVSVPREWLRGANIQDFFALYVHGQSMAPWIMDGDIAVFRQQSDVSSGDFALIVYGDDIDTIGSYGTLKQIRKESDGGLSLVALNPDYETLTLNGSDLQSVRIQGRLVQTVRKF